MKRLALATVVFVIESHALVAFGGEKRYHLIPLGELPGGSSNSIALDVNDSLQVAVKSWDADGAQPAYWEFSSGLLKITLAPDTILADVVALNDSETFVGSASTMNETIASRWRATQGMELLGDLPGGFNLSRARGINDAGQIVGWSSSANTETIPGEEAFIWDEVNGMVGIGDMPGISFSSDAYDINDNGVVTGIGTTFNGHEAFIWTEADGFTPLGFLDGQSGFSRGFAINNLGQVVGDTNSSNGREAFLWDQANGMIGLGDLPGGIFHSEAADINNIGHVVGFSLSLPNNGAEAFLWTPESGMQSLNSLLTTSGEGWFITNASAINDAGVIAAFGQNPDNNQEAVLLVPIEVDTVTAATNTSVIWTSVLVIVAGALGVKRRATAS